uniref:Uncharacterized protein n=1 Tax=Anguilla anguilla TaxID=7936 RepID=A0A0E9T268_ANGAN
MSDTDYTPLTQQNKHVSHSPYNVNVQYNVIYYRFITY